MQVRGFDLYEQARKSLEQEGGRAVLSAAEAATGADVLLLMVVNAAQAQSVLFGTDGAATAAAPGAVVMICSTIAPIDVCTIAQQLEQHGLLILDAPVSGGQVGAEGGTLTVMASGSAAAFQVARPVLEAISSKLHEVGTEPGLGATYKVVHQLAAGVHLAAAGDPA